MLRIAWLCLDQKIWLMSVPHENTLPPEWRLRNWVTLYLTPSIWIRHRLSGVGAGVVGGGVTFGAGVDVRAGVEVGLAIERSEGRGVLLTAFGRAVGARLAIGDGLISTWMGVATASVGAIGVPYVTTPIITTALIIDIAIKIFMTCILFKSKIFKNNIAPPDPELG